VRALEKVAHQFRVVQKRLLARYKDKNPAPLQYLDAIFQGTYAEILQLSGDMERCRAKMKANGLQLGRATALMLLLIRFKFGLDEANISVLADHFTPNVVDNDEQGWEEYVDSSLGYLLRSVLVKTNAGPSSVVSSIASTGMAADTSRLKSHIQAVCDRLGKGAKLATKQSVNLHTHVTPQTALLRQAPSLRSPTS